MRSRKLTHASMKKNSSGEMKGTRDHCQERNHGSGMQDLGLLLSLDCIEFLCIKGRYSLSI